MKSSVPPGDTLLDAALDGRGPRTHLRNVMNMGFQADNIVQFAHFGGMSLGTDRGRRVVLCAGGNA